MKEDNNGFVDFPVITNDFNRSLGKTLVYIVAFDLSDMSGDPYVLSNIKLNIDGDFVKDDINSRSLSDRRLFENNSITMTSCVCLGWIESIFSKDNKGWYATFRDLTNDGKNMYYTFRKLHNNKEVRILTFNKD